MGYNRDSSISHTTFLFLPRTYPVEFALAGETKSDARIPTVELSINQVLLAAVPQRQPVSSLEIISGNLTLASQNGP